MISVSMKMKPFIDASSNEDIKFEWTVTATEGKQEAYMFAYKAENSNTWTKNAVVTSEDKFFILPKSILKKNISYEFKVRVWSETEQSEWSEIITSLNRIPAIKTIGTEKLRVVPINSSDKDSRARLKTESNINEFDLVETSNPSASKVRIKENDGILSIARERTNHTAYTNHTDTGNFSVYINHSDNGGYSTYDDHVDYSEARYSDHEDSYSKSDGHNNSEANTVYGDHYNVYGDPNASGYLENWLYSETCNATTYTNENGTVIHANCGSKGGYNPHVDYSEGYAEHAYNESGYTASGIRYSKSGYSAYVDHQNGGYSKYSDHSDVN